MGFGSGLSSYVPSLTYQCDPQAEAVVAKHGLQAVVYDLGAGGRKIAPHVQTVDFFDSPGTDIVADVTDLPIEADSADLVISTGLIEHVEDAGAVFREMHRILKPGGEVYIEIPFMQQHHDDPIDVRRYTVPGLALTLERHGFEVIDKGFNIGPTVAVLTLSSYWWAMLFEGENIVSKVLSNGVFLVFSVLALPFRYLDKWLMTKKSAYRLAFGVYCLARKSAPK